jgi:hypothetical protein
VTTTGDEVGVGVGPWATVGALCVGLADGSTDGVGFEDAGGADSDAPGPEGGSLAVDVDGLALAGSAELPGTTTLGDGDDPRATPRSGCAGAIRPAVSATVARTRLRSPIATTRRARWAEVTTKTGSFRQVPWRRSLEDEPMVAPGPPIPPVGDP